MTLMLLEHRVKQFKKHLEDDAYSYDHYSTILKEAEILIQDLWMSLQIYRAIDKETRGKQSETVSSNSERKP